MQGCYYILLVDEYLGDLISEHKYLDLGWLHGDWS